MMYKQRKKAQRKMNHRVRMLNKNIQEDNLWKGRFEVRQKDSIWSEFSDGSGGELYVNLRFYDKKTGYYKDAFLDMLYPCEHEFFNYQLFLRMNEFIINDCGVWDETPSPRETEKFIKDYTKQHIPDSVMKKDYNYYCSKEAF